MIEQGAVLYKPSNVVPENEAARKQWMEDWNNYMAWSAYRCFTYERDVLPIMYAHGNIPESETSHITDMFTKTGEQAGGLTPVLPAVMGDYNYIITLINKQLARALSNDIVFNGSVADETAIADKLEEVSKRIADQLTRVVRQQAGIHKQLGTPIVKGDDVEHVDMEKLKHMNFASELVDSEIAVNKAMAWLMGDKSLFLQHKLVHQILFTFLCTAKMAGEVYVREGKPDIIPIPSGQLIYDLYSYSPFVQMGDLAGHWSYCTPQEIAAACPRLTKKQIDELEARVQGFGNNATLNPPIVSGAAWFYNSGQQNGKGALPYKTALFRNYWKAIKMERAVITPNLIDESKPHIEYIKDGEEPVLDEELGQYFETVPRNVVYQGTRVTDLFHYECQEMPGRTELPIVGFVDTSPSLVRIMMHCQRMMSECMYVVERLMGQIKGNIIWLDKANPDDMMENLASIFGYGIGYHDSSKEGVIQNYGGQQNNNIPRSTDMAASAGMGDIMRLFMMLKGIMQDLVGSSDAAEGKIKSDQTVGATKNSTIQSQLSMQATFDKWFTTLEMFGQALCDELKTAWSGQEKHLTIMGLKGTEYFKIKPEDFDPDTKHIIRIGNSVRSDEIRQMVIGMAEKILPIAKEPEMALTIIKLVESHSGAEAVQIFTKGVDALNKLKEQAEQSGQAQAGQAQAAAKEIEQMKDIREDKALASKERIAAAHEIAETERANIKIGHEEDKQEIAHDLLVKQKILDGIVKSE